MNWAKRSKIVASPSLGYQDGFLVGREGIPNGVETVVGYPKH